MPETVTNWNPNIEVGVVQQNPVTRMALKHLEDRVMALEARVLKLEQSYLRLLRPESPEMFRKMYQGKNIAYVRDVSPQNGLNEKELVEEGRNRGYEIHVFDNTMLDEELHGLGNYTLIVVSQVGLFSEADLATIWNSKVPFVKLEQGPPEKGHGTLLSRSTLNIFLSEQHRNDYRAALTGVDGVFINKPTDFWNIIAGIIG